MTLRKARCGRRRCVQLLGVACLASVQATAQGTEAPATGVQGPPRMTVLRYDEDYGYLANLTNRRGGWWEPTKFIPQGDSGDVYLALGAELRARWEGFQNELFGEEDPPDRDYVWLRALPYGDLHVGPHARGFVQLISAFEVGDELEATPIDENRADVLQGFVELASFAGEGRVAGRVGRQVLAYGSQRLISTRYGPNVLQAFDVAKVVYDHEDWQLDAFVGFPVDHLPGEFDDASSETETIWSVYGTRALDLADSSGLDLYYIGFIDDEAVFNQGGGEEERHTFGARFFGTSGRWDWNHELFGQVGTFGSGNIRAWSVATLTGYTFEDAPWRPRVGFKANVISGDDDPGDGDLETFNPLFPNGKYFGEIGLLGPYNLINLHASLDLEASEQVQFGFGAVSYWRESTGDGIYDNGGFLIRPDGGASERHIGVQLDAAITYAPHRNYDFTLAYSTLLPGGFIEATGEDETVQFAAVEARFRF